MVSPNTYEKQIVIIIKIGLWIIDILDYVWPVHMHKILSLHFVICIALSSSMYQNINLEDVEKRKGDFGITQIMLKPLLFWTLLIVETHFHLNIWNHSQFK